MRLPLTVAVTALSSIVLFSLPSTAKADTAYPVTGDLTSVQTNLVITPGTGEDTWTTTISATNTSTQTLFNVYEFSTDVSVNGQSLTLISPGEYANSTYFAAAANAAVLITPDETNASLDSASSGSSTTPEIPGFLIANTLAPGQTVSFNEVFDVSTSAGSFTYGFFDTATTATPELSGIALLGTAALGIAAVLKRRRLA